jgi:hypothetical protein
VPVYLLHRNVGVGVARWLPPLVGLCYSVVAYGVFDLLVAFDVPRCARKRICIYLTRINF